MTDKLVVLAEYRDLPQAGLALSSLEAQGIQCFLDNQYTAGGNRLHATALGGIQLKVHACDATRANEILCRFDTFLVAGLNGGECAPEGTCPRCGSAEILSGNHPRKFAALSPLLSLPIFSLLKSKRCNRCGHKWK